MRAPHSTENAADRLYCPIAQQRSVQQEARDAESAFQQYTCFEQCAVGTGASYTFCGTSRGVTRTRYLCISGVLGSSRSRARSMAFQVSESASAIFLGAANRGNNNGYNGFSLSPTKMGLPHPPEVLPSSVRVRQ
eukprot:scaffold17399_cov122-Isochrysis_galbana.AAC.3